MKPGVAAGHAGNNGPVQPPASMTLPPAANITTFFVETTPLGAAGPLPGPPQNPLSELDSIVSIFPGKQIGEADR